MQDHGNVGVDRGNAIISTTNGVQTHPPFDMQLRIVCDNLHDDSEDTIPTPRAHDVSRITPKKSLCKQLCGIADEKSSPFSFADAPDRIPMNHPCMFIEQDESAPHRIFSHEPLGTGVMESRELFGEVLSTSPCTVADQNIVGKMQSTSSLSLMDTNDGFYAKAPPGLHRFDSEEEINFKASAKVKTSLNLVACLGFEESKAEIPVSNPMVLSQLGQKLTVSAAAAFNGPTDGTIISVGSVGHPVCCGGGCKFNFKKRGCKDGLNCTRCHLCKWRPAVERAIARQKRAAHLLCDTELKSY